MRHALRLPTFLTLLLATAAVNKHEDPHEHAAALKKREVNSRHADAGKKQVKVTFTNYLPVAGGHRLWWDGGVGRQHQADLGYVKQTYIAGTFEGHRWWVENEDGETVWQMVVDEGKGAFEAALCLVITENSLAEQVDVHGIAIDPTFSQVLVDRAGCGVNHQMADEAAEASTGQCHDNPG